MSIVTLADPRDRRIRIFMAGDNMRAERAKH